MAFSREQLEGVWRQGKRTLSHPPFEKGRKYLNRDIPEQLFPIQEWCIKQSSAPDEFLPDLSCIFQGLEYLLQAATGKFPDEMVLTEKEISGTMVYLNREDDFENGALRQFPELQIMIRSALLELPKGQEVIDIIQSIKRYDDLFREEVDI